MNARTFLTILACFLIVLVWQKTFVEPPSNQSGILTQRQPQPPHQQQNVVGKIITQTPQTESKLSLNKIEAPAVETKIIPVKTGTVQFNNQNRLVTAWELKGYRQGKNVDSPYVDISRVTQHSIQGELAFDDNEFVYLNEIFGTFLQGSNTNHWVYEDEKIRIVREAVNTQGNAFIDFNIRAEFKSVKPKYAFLSLTLHAPKEDPEAQDRQILYWTNKEINRELIEKASHLSEISTPVKWIGISSRYFVLSLVSRGEPEPRGLVQPLGEKKTRISLVYPIIGDSIIIPVRFFFGPKELNILKEVEPTLDHTVDFGWFTVIAYPLLKLMKLFYSLIHNYGIAIILLTLVVNILTYPLTYKSMKSMKEMAKIQPQIQKVREKYKDDREAMNREMLILMKSHGYNPMAGCLPILVQMPVFIALYRVLYSAIELYQAPFMYWIQDLSARDPYYVTPIVLTAVMFIQQKLTPTTATDPTQAKILQFMPVFFGVLMLLLPSGLTIYMLTNAIASSIRQVILNKKLDIQHGTSVVVTPTRAR